MKSLSVASLIYLILAAPICSASGEMASLQLPAGRALETSHFIAEDTSSPTQCGTDQNCAEDQYCAEGTCLMHSACKARSDCFNPSNMYDIIECVGPIDCYEGKCGRECTGDMCPSGLDFANCFAPPCQVSTCGEGSIACSNDYCGGCNAIHFDVAGNQICAPTAPDTACDSDDDCGKSEYCSKGSCLALGKCSDDVDCFNPSNDLILVTCAGVKSCQDGQCELQCGDSMCPEGSEEVECFDSPCNNHSCDEATSCVDNYCGGCNTIHFDAAGFQICIMDDIDDNQESTSNVTKKAEKQETTQDDDSAGVALMSPLKNSFMVLAVYVAVHYI